MWREKRDGKIEVSEALNRIVTHGSKTCSIQVKDHDTRYSGIKIQAENNESYS
jgi:hypothetical protein